MCCVEAAVVSACGGGGCIVVMRWIVVATVRVKVKHLGSGHIYITINVKKLSLKHSVRAIRS